MLCTSRPPDEDVSPSDCELGSETFSVELFLAAGVRGSTNFSFVTFEIDDSAFGDDFLSLELTFFIGDETSTRRKKYERE